MLRKFKINNYIKGQLFRVGNAEALKTESYKKNTHILEFNTDNLTKSQISILYSILGIDDNSPYKELHLCREIIGELEKEGYVRMKKKYISEESDKAIKLAGSWIPKSQSIVEGKYVYIKEWLFEKNSSFFEFENQ